MREILDRVLPIDGEEVDDVTLAEIIDGLPYLPPDFYVINTDEQGTTF